MQTQRPITLAECDELVARANENDLEVVEIPGVLVDEYALIDHTADTAELITSHYVNSQQSHLTVETVSAADAVAWLEHRQPHVNQAMTLKAFIAKHMQERPDRFDEASIQRAAFRIGADAEGEFIDLAGKHAVVRTLVAAGISHGGDTDAFRSMHDELRNIARTDLVNLVSPGNGNLDPFHLTLTLDGCSPRVAVKNLRATAVITVIRRLSRQLGVNAYEFEADILNMLDAIRAELDVIELSVAWEVSP